MMRKLIILPLLGILSILTGFGLLLFNSNDNNPENKDKEEIVYGNISVVNGNIPKKLQIEGKYELDDILLSSDDELSSFEAKVINISDLVLEEDRYEIIMYNKEEEVGRFNIYIEALLPSEETIVVTFFDGNVYDIDEIEILIN